MLTTRCRATCVWIRWSFSLQDHAAAQCSVQRIRYLPGRVIALLAARRLVRSSRNAHTVGRPCWQLLEIYVPSFRTGTAHRPPLSLTTSCSLVGSLRPCVCALLGLCMLVTHVVSGHLPRQQAYSVLRRHRCLVTGVTSSRPHMRSTRFTRLHLVIRVTLPWTHV